MKAEDAGKLQPGDVILVRVRVTTQTKPNTLGHSRGWINCETISDSGLLGTQDLVVSCADAVTPEEMRTWIEARAHRVD